MIKVAFVLDPYPTRGSMSMLVLQALQFIEIAKKLEDDGFQCAIICSPYVSNDIRRRTQSYNAFFSGTYNSRLAFARALSNWNSQDVETWRQINRGSDVWTDIYQKWLSSIIEFEYQFDICVVWGNNRSLVDAIAECGRQSFVFELGPMRDPLLDLVTFARDASPPTKPLDMDIDLISKHLKKTPSLVEDQLYIEGLLGKPAYFTETRYKWNSKFAEIGGGSLKGRKILFAGQLFDDSNAAFWKADLEQIVDQLIVLTRDNGAALIVKPHPNYRAYEVNETEWKKLRKKWVAHDHVVEIAHEDLDGAPILSLVDGVVAANSSILYEALYWGLPISYFGSTYFLPEHNLLSFTEVVTGNYDEVDYLRKASVIRQVVLEKKCLLKDDFIDGSFLRRAIEPSIPLEASSFRAGKAKKARFNFTQMPQVSPMRERMEGGQQKLELADGVSFCIVKGKTKSNYETIDDVGETVELKGWCLIENTRTPPIFYIVPIRGGKCLVCPSSLSRPDVARFWHEEDAGMCGFRFRLNKADVDISTISRGVIYAYVGNDEIEPFHQGEFNPGEGFFDFTLLYHQPVVT